MGKEHRELKELFVGMIKDCGGVVDLKLEGGRLSIGNVGWVCMRSRISWIVLCDVIDEMRSSGRIVEEIEGGGGYKITCEVSQREFQ